MVPLTLLVLLVILRGYSCLENEKCADYAKDIDYHHPTISYTPPRPTGVWVSSRCEIVPNPRYILRRLDIQTTKWTSYIYHYDDSWCSKPTFTVKVTGGYEMLAATATPNSKASYGAKFHFTNVYFRAKNAKIIENVINLILEKCPNALPSISSMQNNDNIDLERYVNKDIPLEVKALLSKKHCRYYFVLHPGTYRKVRMTGETNRGNMAEEYDTLYFASIFSFPLNRHQTDISRKYQYGLSRLNRPDCEVCGIMSKITKPDVSPSLKVPKARRNFGGSWVSKTCEATDDKTFQSKFYNFRYSDRSFTAQSNYYSNIDCKIKKFNLKFGGNFGKVTSTKNVVGVYEVWLDLKWMTLTIYEDATISLVRNGGSSCGDPSKWRIGVEQNLTESNGCKLLGFEIPSSLQALLRVSKTKSSQDLYLSFIEEKGTFFSSNYVSCNSATENFKKRITTTKPTPKKHVVPEVKDFDLENSFKTDSAGNRGMLNSLTLLMVGIVHFFLLLLRLV